MLCFSMQKYPLVQFRSIPRREHYWASFLPEGMGLFSPPSLPPPCIVLVRGFFLALLTSILLWAAFSNAISQFSQASMSSVPVPWPQEDLRGKSSLGDNDIVPMKSSFCWQAWCVDLRALTFYPGVFGLGPYFCSEINDLYFLNATKGTFKMLISSFTEFSSEGISACSGWITILFSLVAMY